MPPAPGGNAEGPDILRDYSVTDKWHKGWSRELSEVSEVVIHHTGGYGDIHSLKEWMPGPDFDWKKLCYELNSGESILSKC